MTDMAEQISNLADDFSAYSRWRSATMDAVTRLRSWLARHDVGDAQSDLRLQYVLNRLRDDKLSIAFIAEFSRGKSELINAIFFSDYGDRILPSSAGRTTMCPTELMWQDGATPELRLLSIASRAQQMPVSEFKRFPSEWEVTPLQTQSADALRTALARVGEVIRVPRNEATRLGFEIDPEGEKGLVPAEDGFVEIPRWRHAIVQFPHPLLEQGLVVLDTPGLNAIGTEPELTLSLLPSAHAVLFILAADTGVTQSDLTVWREYMHTGGQGRQKGRLVVLNKIDGLWDGLREEAQIDAEIERQMASVSHTLGVAPSVVFPVSAQKGLVARINGDTELLARSRLQALEKALTEDLLPTKQEIVRESTLSETEELVAQTRALLDARLRGVCEQLKEITDLRGKNQSVIEYMMRKIRMEKGEFEEGLQKYYAVRSVFSNLTNSLLAHLGLDELRDETRRTREAMLKATFSKGLRVAMEGFFGRLHGKLRRSNEEIAEITNMLDAMHKRFSTEHGLKLYTPEAFSTQRYEQELDRLENAFNRQFTSALALVTTEKHNLTQKFFETVAAQARHTFEVANHDVEQWLRAVMSPLETQVREYQIQLKRRLESVKRIHQATDTLEDRVDELRQAENTVLVMLDELSALNDGIGNALGVVSAANATGTPATGAAEIRVA